MPLIGLGLLLAHGCSSTLDEYRCTATSQCIDNNVQGICHTSGYCAYVDNDECDGYRFGGYSGEQSDQCVGADNEVDASMPGAPDGIADAGPNDPDAAPLIPVPTAAIGAVVLACDLTALDIDGSASVPVDNTTLTNFRWVLRAPGGAQISELSGAPGNGFTPIRGFVSGSVAQPRINLTPYLDNNALEIDTAGGHSAIRQSGIAIAGGDRTFSFSIGTPELGDVGEKVDVDITGSGQGATTAVNVTLASSMIRHSANFTLAGDVSNARIIVHSDGARYYLDNFRIHENGPGGSSSAEAVQNPSLELGFSPWSVGPQTGNGATATSAPLPASLKEYGDYELELVVTDSNGTDSPPATIQITHASCSGGSGGN